ncbi:sugar phosphate permease [Rhodococcus sp. OK302]|nr:MFS transporter [Rhodococcus sp. OK302]OYD66672.1 sugar phosphate permease [Rhodococcus sp. OK302]
MVLEQQVNRTRAKLGEAGESRTVAWGMTSVLVAMYVINFADKAVLGIIAQPLAKELGLSASDIGLAGSAFFLMLSLGGLLSGALDKWLGLRWALVLLVVLWSVAMLPLMLSASFVTLLVSRMILGFAEGPNSPLLFSAAYSWHAPARRGLPGAILTCSASIAKIAIAPILAYVAITWGWRSALVALAISGLLWAVLWLAVWKEGPYGSSAHTAHGDGADSDAVAAPVNDAEPAVPWMNIFRTRTFIGGVLLIAAAYALAAVVLTWLPSYFELGLGYTRLQAGSMFSIPSLIGLVIMLSTTWFSDRLITRGVSLRAARVIFPAVGMLIGGSLLVILPYISTPVLAVLFVSAGYAICTPVLPLLNACVSELCPPKQLSGVLGVFLSLMAFGGFIAPYMMGRIVDAAGKGGDGYAMAFQILGVVALIVAVIGILIIDPARDKRLVRPDAPVIAVR